MPGRDMARNIHQIDPASPDADVIKNAARIMKTGGVVGYATRDLYGLGVDAFNPAAIKRVFGIKRRLYQKPLSVLIQDRTDLDALVTHITPAANLLMDQFWPGKITLVFKAKKFLPSILTADSGKIGIRLPAHPVAAALVSAFGGPITATSANLSGKPGCAQISDLPHEVIEQIDLVLDAGPLGGGLGSTVVDVSIEPPVVLREGAVSVAALMQSY